MNKKMLERLLKRNRQALEARQAQIEAGEIREDELEAVNAEVDELIAEGETLADEIANFEDDAEPTDPEPTDDPDPEDNPGDVDPEPEPTSRAGMLSQEERDRLSANIGTGLAYRGRQSDAALNNQVRKAFANFVVGRIDEAEARSLGVEVGNGSVTIPEVIASEIITYAQEANPLRRLGEVVRTKGDVKYPFLVKKAEANVNKKERTKEITETDIEFDEILLDPAEFDALATVTKKLLKMSGAPIETIVVDELKKAYVRKEANYMFNGDDAGNENPGALAKKAVAFTPEVAVDLSAANAGALMYDALIDLKNAPVTEVMNRGRFMLNRAALKTIEKMKDANGDPLIRPMTQVEGGIGNLLVGYPFEVTDYTDKKGEPDIPVFYFGDFYSFKIQDVIGAMELQKLIEKFSGTNKVGFQIYNLLDGQLIYSPFEPSVYRFEIGKAAPGGES